MRGKVLCIRLSKFLKIEFAKFQNIRFSLTLILFVRSSHIFLLLFLYKHRETDNGNFSNEVQSTSVHNIQFRLKHLLFSSQTIYHAIKTIFKTGELNWTSLVFIFVMRVLYPRGFTSSVPRGFTSSVSSEFTSSVPR